MALLSGGGVDGRRPPPSSWWKPGSSPSFSSSIIKVSFSVSLLETLRRRSSSISVSPASESSSAGLGPRIQSVRRNDMWVKLNKIIFGGFSVCFKGAIHQVEVQLACHFIGCTMLQLFSKTCFKNMKIARRTSLMEMLSSCIMGNVGCDWYLWAKYLGIVVHRV